MINDWIADNYIEVFGAITGIIYVFLEIRQKIWLWPLGIITSGLYVWIFFTSKLYADMSLQAYYVLISVLGWYWWMRGLGRQAQSSELRDHSTKQKLAVTRIKLKIAVILTAVFVVLYTVMYIVLSRLTDSPVPGWDSFLTSLSVIATWMLARKIYEHWYLWIVINIVSALLYFTRDLFPTVVLYAVYLVMSFIGLIEWKKTIEETILPDE